MFRLTAVSLLLNLLVLTPAYSAQSAVQLYTGRMDILVTSGKACEGLAGSHQVSLAVAGEIGSGGELHGYFVGGGITIGRFAGSDPGHLDVRYPYQEELRSSGHYLTLTHSDGALVAELHDRHIDAAAEDCNFDLARMELTRSGEADAAARLAQMNGLFDAQLTRSQAVNLAQANDYGAALPIFEKALVLADTYLEKGSDQINSYIVGLATSYVWLDRFDDFDRLFDTRIMPLQDEAIRSVFSPYRVRTLLHAGRTALGRDENDAALKIFERAYALQPRNREVIAAVMSILVRTGRYTEAVSFLERTESVLESEAERRDIRGAMALVLFKKAQKDDKAGSGPEAEIALKRALELDPGSVHILIALARQHHKAGRLADAERLLDQGAEQFKDDAVSQQQIAAARDKIHQTELFLKKIRKDGN